MTDKLMSSGNQHMMRGCKMKGSRICWGCVLVLCIDMRAWFVLKVSFSVISCMRRLWRRVQHGYWSEKIYLRV